ncbi:MAG: geranylgeranyl reductase family protein [Acidimicrobiia bacterium]
MPNPEVVVVGGGPAGSAAAYRLAEAGRDVLLAERKSYPREKTCGDGLTPRAIFALQEMGFDFEVPTFHKVDGIRSYAGDDYLELTWPQHSQFPAWGGVIRRSDLDEQVVALARKQGAAVSENTEARPLLVDGSLEGVELVSDGETETMNPLVVIVADGSLSRFGRALGAERRRDYPLGLAARAYWTSPRADDRFMESQLDLRDARGDTLPGYGWVFPLGDGTVNVGVGLLSTFRRWKDVNTTTMLYDYAASAPDYWSISEETRLTDPRGGKLSMALSLGPLVGPNWVVVGDAAAAINPWNGEGISLAYETGRMSAEVVHAALEANDLSLLSRYPQELSDTYGDYYRFARLFGRAIGRPTVMRSLAHVGLNSRPLMEWVLTVMANLLEPSERGIGEQVYRMLERLVRVTPGF